MQATHINNFFHIAPLIAVKSIGLIQRREQQFTRLNFRTQACDEELVFSGRVLDVLLDFVDMRSI